jgi:uridine monophosphate synthetase|uniref:Uridine 5'-monophosphate synthase n=1 Tax=viral metagenome TaxID=1070528 RepID=A0A6C0BYK4_9ZZZZ
MVDHLVNEFYRKNIVLSGEFTLKSGEKSDMYFDARKISMYPNLMKEVAKQMAGCMLKSDWVCGVPYGAMALATTVSLITETPQLVVRKDKKEHGTQKQIEGDFKKGDNVIVIEDVVNTGGSMNKICKIIEDNGMHVIMKLCIINRGDILSVRSLLVSKNLVEPKSCLVHHMDKKIIWAADTGTMKALFTGLDKYGSKIAVLKIHIDTYCDYSHENIVKLQSYKEKYGFMIWEDRKFADIGDIMKQQIRNSIYSYLDWVDIFSIHGLVGSESINAVIDEFDKMKWILVGQMSASNNLIERKYTKSCIEIYKSRDNIIGMVCQENLGKDIIHIVPGISKHIASDNAGQSYSQMCEKPFADFFVVGRSISKFLD